MSYTLEYWQTAAVRDPYSAVRTGWSAADFDRRTDESICHLIDFKPGDVVLDYGCGPGYACKLVAPKVKLYIGVDYSREMLALARKRNGGYRNAVFACCDGLSIPAHDAAFDCVFCELVFQHNDRNTTLEVLGEIKRVLKPGGRVALQFPTVFYGKDVGFTVEELAGLCPGWRVEPDAVHPSNYIVCLTPR